MWGSFSDIEGRRRSQACDELGKSHPGGGMRAKGLEGRKRLVSLGNRRKPSVVLGSDGLGVGGGGNDIGSTKVC